MLLRQLVHTTAIGITLAFTASNVFAGLVSVTNSTTGLFDGSAGTRTVAITGLEPGYDTGIIADVNISIDFAKADGESFDPPYPNGIPWFSEIRFQLTNPVGSAMTLIDNGSFDIGSSSSLFDGVVVFDQSAGSLVNFNIDLLQAGTFRPTGPGSLNNYNGASALGTWSLLIEDSSSLDALRFRSFTLDIQTVPEPSSLALAGIAAVGLFAVARWRRSNNRAPCVNSACIAD